MDVSHVRRAATPLHLRPRPTDVVVAASWFRVAPLQRVPSAATGEVRGLAEDLLAGSVALSRRTVSGRSASRLPLAPRGWDRAVEDLGGASDVLVALLPTVGRQLVWHPQGLSDADGWIAWTVLSCLRSAHRVLPKVGRGDDLPSPDQDVVVRAVRRLQPWNARGSAVRTDEAVAGPWRATPRGGQERPPAA